jgi:hypothetical protein
MHALFSDTEYVQWEYRDTKGVLHSGVALTVEDARRMAEQASGDKINISHQEGK